MSVRYAAKCGNEESAAKCFPATVLHGHRRVGAQLIRGPNRKGWTRSYVEVLINSDFLIVIPYEPYAPANTVV